VTAQQQSVFLGLVGLIFLLYVVCELQITIGSAEFQCLCVRYVTQDDTPLIVGLSVALTLLLIIFIIFVVLYAVLYLRRHGKMAIQEQVPRDRCATSPRRNRGQMQHCTQLPNDHTEQKTSPEQHTEDTHCNKQFTNDYSEDTVM